MVMRRYLLADSIIAMLPEPEKLKQPRRSRKKESS